MMIMNIDTGTWTIKPRDLKTGKYIKIPEYGVFTVTKEDCTINIKKYPAYDKQR